MLVYIIKGGIMTKNKELTDEDITDLCKFFQLSKEKDRTRILKHTKEYAISQNDLNVFPQDYNGKQN
jgi:hypothetical protein